MTEQAPAPSTGDRIASFWVRLVRLLVRLLLVALLGIGVGLGVYYGIPALYRNYLEPVQVNTQRIGELEDRLAQEAAAAAEERATWNARLADLEGRLAEQEEDLAALQAGLDAANTSDSLQDDRLRGLTTRLSDLERELDAASALVETLVGSDSTVQRLERQTQMLQALIVLTRARMWLMQNNLGLAMADIRAAQVILTAAEAEGATPPLAPVLERLDLALQDLATAPVVAADDLEIAWQLLLTAAGPSGAPAPTPTAPAGGTR